MSNRKQTTIKTTKISLSLLNRSHFYKSASVGLHDFLNVIAVVVYPVYLCLIDVNAAPYMYMNAWTAP